MLQKKKKKKMGGGKKKKLRQRVKADRKKERKREQIPLEEKEMPLKFYLLLLNKYTSARCLY